MLSQGYRALLIVGMIVAFAGTPTSSNAAILLDNTNTLTVTVCPQPVVNCSPQFTVKVPTTIDDIQDYHRQTGPGAGKTISLMATGGSIIGPFQVTVQPATPGFENWKATVGQTVPPDTYTVIDSQADTWEQNSKSNNKGFSIVRGSPAAASAGSVTDCTASCANPSSELAKPFPHPIFACSAHGPFSRCTIAAPSGDNPGVNVSCTDGRNITTCNCQSGCSTR
jgi:hypothetical protein